jgi:uncharacterized protein
MTRDPDHAFGLLSPEDQEKMEQILTERSEGTYGIPALHGMLTASVVGPSPVPLEWILQAVLSPPDSEAIEIEFYPEFSWVAEKAEELLLRISQVFAEDPELFRLLVYMPKLKEGDTTPDPQTWCNGFVEGMAYHQEDWKPILTTEDGFLALAPILMTSDPDEWDDKDVLNPFTELTPLELCDALKLGTLAVYNFWSIFESGPTPIRASETPGRNDPCPCGSGKKYKRCCGRGV